MTTNNNPKFSRWDRNRIRYSIHIWVGDQHVRYAYLFFSFVPSVLLLCPWLLFLCREFFLLCRDLLLCRWLLYACRGFSFCAVAFVCVPWLLFVCHGLFVCMCLQDKYRKKRVTFLRGSVGGGVFKRTSIWRFSWTTSICDASLRRKS